MYAYHEVNPDALEATLTNGLKRDSRGDKGDDESIIKVDKLLDENCPEDLKGQGVSRQNNLYAYVQYDDHVISIDNGEPVPIDEFVSRSQQSVLRLQIDPKRCFVSDLDTYDAVKNALKQHVNQKIINELVKSYWDKLTPLPRYTHGTFSRPEIMVTYDVPAADVEYLFR